MELTLQANRFALDNRSLADSLGSTGPGQYEAGPSELQALVSVAPPQVKGCIDPTRQARSFGASHRAYDKVRPGPVLLSKLFVSVALTQVPRIREGGPRTLLSRTWTSAALKAQTLGQMQPDCSSSRSGEVWQNGVLLKGPALRTQTINNAQEILRETSCCHCRRLAG